MMVRREPRPYQREALAAWQKAGGRGVVVLPTGAGKTLVAQLALEDRQRQHPGRHTHAGSRAPVVRRAAGDVR
jgi:superfamily II DNA or RNA helicase